MAIERKGLLKKWGVFKNEHGAEGEAGQRGVYWVIRGHWAASMTKPGEVFQQPRKDGVYTRAGNRWLWILLVTGAVLTVLIVLWWTQSRPPRAFPKITATSSAIISPGYGCIAYVSPVGGPGASTGERPS